MFSSPFRLDCWDRRPGHRFVSSRPSSEIGGAQPDSRESVSIIVVSWNACAHLRRCLQSIELSVLRPARQVIVVDNHSCDGSPDMVAREFPQVVLVRMAVNVGFARGVNEGLRRASGAKLAIVNSDVVLRPGCLQTLADSLDADPGLGLVGPQIVDGNNRIQRSCRRLPTVWNSLCRALALDLLFPALPIFSGHEMRHLRHDRRQAVEALSGCLLMTSRAALDAVGPLDERFFFYMEDVDWCLRFRQKGWTLLFVAQAVAAHHGGASTANAPLHYSIQYHRAGLSYWHKHRGFAGAAFYWCVANLHHALRLTGRCAAAALGDASPEARHKRAEDRACLRWLWAGAQARPQRASPAASLSGSTED